MVEVTAGLNTTNFWNGRSYWRINDLLCRPPQNIAIQSALVLISAMVVKLRLARFGRKNSPFYNIVVAHARTARNSKPLEVIGTYDPIPKKDLYDDSGKLHKDIKLDLTRAKYWIGVGAQPTDTVWRLLSMVGILAPKYRPGQSHSSQPSADAPPPLKDAHIPAKV